MSVSAENVVETYDGNEYGATASANLTGATILYKDGNGEYTLTQSPNWKDVTDGAQTVEFKASLYGYADAYGSATVTINKRAVTITADSASKIYDGEPLTAEYTYTDLVKGEAIQSVTVTGSQTLVGSSANVASDAVIVNAAGDIVTGNYDITYVDGTLTVTHNAEGTAYKVAYLYQNPAKDPADKESYVQFGEMRSDVTTAGAIAYLNSEDIIPQQEHYRYNAEKSDAVKTVTADGETVLCVYFDAVYNVVYKYKDDSEVTQSGYIYHYGDTVIAPGVASLEQFDGRWYKEIGLENEWVFAAEPISGNNISDVENHVIYLYTSAKVTPLNGNTITITKRAENAPNANTEYGFNLQLSVTAAADQTPLDDKTSREVLLLKAAQVEADKKLAEMKGKVSEAERSLTQSTFLTTTGSNLKFILTGSVMDDGLLPVLYSATSGSAYEFKDYNDYNIYENPLDARGGEISSADADTVNAIIGVIQSMAYSRMPIETVDAITLFDNLNAADINTSGSALAFSFDSANELFAALKGEVEAKRAADQAEEALNNLLKNLGRRATVTVTEPDGRTTEYVLIDKDDQGNFIWTKDFGFTLRNGDSNLFKVTATTGSTIQFIITETADGGAVSTTVNGISGNSVSGVLTTGSALEYTFVNTFNGGGGNGNGGNGGDGGYDGPYSDDPSDDDTIIDDPNVPLTEPDVDDTDDGIAIDDGDVPLSDVPGEAVEIGEPQVPLGDAPKTGDANNAIPFVVLMMMAGLGLVITRRKFN